jgi:Flp pilus assembly protein TadD
MTRSLQSGDTNRSVIIVTSSRADCVHILCPRGSLSIDRLRRQVRCGYAVGGALNTLGLIYYSLGRYAEAETTFRWAIAVAEATSSANDWTMGARLNNLAMTLTAQGR